MSGSGDVLSPSLAVCEPEPLWELEDGQSCFNQLVVFLLCLLLFHLLLCARVRVCEGEGTVCL